MKKGKLTKREKMDLTMSVILLGMVIVFGCVLLWIAYG